MSLSSVIQALCGLLSCCVFSLVQAADAFSGNYAGNSQTKNMSAMQRDPFTTSDKMYSEVGIQNAQKSNSALGFIAGYGNQSLPKMRLKGFVNKSNKKMVALLEIEGAGVYFVNEGDEIGLQAIGLNTVIKIVKVDTNGVRVQTGQVNQVILVQ